MNAGLSSSRILVTRPGTQGVELCNMIEARGGIAIAFPTIEILPISGPGRDQLIKDLSSSSHIIFISRNAVVCCYALVTELNDILAQKKVFATGPGTSDVLNDHGIVDVACPSGDSGSEGLLSSPGLSGTEINGKHVLIVRGKGGREILRKTLEARDANVKYVEVYARQKPDISAESMDSIWLQEIPDIIVVTSIEGLKNLVELTAEKFRDRLFSRKLVAMSQRIADHASDMGFTGPTVVTHEQSNEGLMLAIQNSAEHLNEY